MRTNIAIDDALIGAAMAATRLPTKKATVEEALRRLVRHHRQQQAIAELQGLGWEGDLDAQRQDTAPAAHAERIERGYALLHADRDFAPMATHPGLRQA